IQHFMRLEAESPLRVTQAVLDCRLDILVLILVILRLKKEMRESELFKLRWRVLRLRVDQLELIPSRLNNFGSCFGTHADPIQSVWSKNGAVRLNRDLESLIVKCSDELCVELQKRLASGAHDVSRILLSDDAIV